MLHSALFRRRYANDFNNKIRTLPKVTLRWTCLPPVEGKPNTGRLLRMLMV
uniref:Uncharacterized protein n=1 Tax=uncultured marine virus TaxID=186617 RepID=A0A0F7L8M7_9VIRU|nr:hypothetical protein [uncultured marine virus]